MVSLFSLATGEEHDVAGLAGQLGVASDHCLETCLVNVPADVCDLAVAPHLHANAGIAAVESQGREHGLLAGDELEIQEAYTRESRLVPQHHTRYQFDGKVSEMRCTAQDERAFTSMTLITKWGPARRGVTERCCSPGGGVGSREGRQGISSKTRGAFWGAFLGLCGCQVQNVRRGDRVEPPPFVCVGSGSGDRASVQIDGAPFFWVGAFSVCLRVLGM